ncbi:MAG: RIP metalloprotease RseP [Opitutae bacterium]|jgi:regulator of sigma E protease|nr:RIP metalloprotease RseP [Opitutae bacterium]
MLLNIFYIAIALLALSFSIFIHELGHFIAAKKRGLIADRFSIGFGPRLFGWKWRGTDFRISLLPLGGYVSLPQLADMGRLEGGEEDENQDLPPISYADKMIVAVMGAVFNIIFAFCLSLILWGVGREIILTTEVNLVPKEILNHEGTPVPGPAYAAGIQEGDQVITIDGIKIRNWGDIDNVIMTGTQRDDSGRALAEIEVLRDGETKRFTVHPELIDVGIDSIRSIAVTPGKGTDIIVLQVQESMPAFEAGMLPGDKILALDGQAITSSAFLSLYLDKHEGGLIDVSVLREEQEVVLPIEPRIAKGETRPRFGFAYGYDIPTVRVHLNPVEQIVAMARQMKQTLTALVSPKSDVKVGNMSGPIGIVHGLTAMARFGWIDLIWFLALINVNLAIFNVLPIPVLDGGHMTFATYRKLTGRPVPRRIMEGSFTICIILLLSFMLYVSYRDVLRVGLDAGFIEDKPNGTPPEVTQPEKPETAETSQIEDLTAGDAENAETNNE